MFLLVWIFLLAMCEPIYCSCTSGPTNNGKGSSCVMGECIEGTCVCEDHWTGSFCEQCPKRSLLQNFNGSIVVNPHLPSNLSRCSWIIQPTMLSFTLKLTFHKFNTKCEKQYLYVFDGDSVFHPLIGSFSGSLQTADQETSLPLEVEIKSGMAYLLYQSTSTDLSTGFNISYFADSCLHDCYGHGNCVGGKCECDAGYLGYSCNLCSRNCSSYPSPLQCADTIDTCSCSEMNCPTSPNGSWSLMELNVSITPGRASSAIASVDHEIWMFSGFFFGYYTSSKQLARYDINGRQWHAVNSSNSPPSGRYGHTIIAWNRNLILFGGKLVLNEQITSEMWKYDIDQSQWSPILYVEDFGVSNLRGNNSNLRLVGHTANLVKFQNGTETMIVLFGYHATTRLGAYVYEYNPSTLRWIMPQAQGARIKGLFGHTAIIDSTTNVIYIHGSPNLDSSTVQTSLDTFSYNPETRTFYILTSSGKPRYLHSGNLVRGVMYIYGGKSTNASSDGNCFLSDMMAYYISCDSWVSLASPSSTTRRNRAGHLSITSPALSPAQRDQVLVFSGYDSTMIDNMLIYSPASCSDFSFDSEHCASSYNHGIFCYWNGTRCTHASNSANSIHGSFCPNKSIEDATNFCSSLKELSCEDCSFNSYNCSVCTSESQGTYCSYNQSLNCQSAENCVVTDSSPLPESTSRNPAVLECQQLTNCFSCSSRQDCVWCDTFGKCYGKIVNDLLYPYPTCHHRVFNPSGCSNLAPKCSSFQTCNQCFSVERCGWCEDELGSGLGRCLNGSLSGPLQYAPDMRSHHVDYGLCPAPRWRFLNCPRCQCNGHSVCNAAFQCLNCADHSTGTNCERCAVGYYGNSTLGSICKRCECNGKAHRCDSSNGDCFCFTKGVTGPTCEVCDTRQQYIGDASGNGTCFYALEQNFVFTFNISESTDVHITSINFQNTPAMEVNVKLEIQSDQPVNIALRATSSTIEKEFGASISLNQTINVRSFMYTFNNDRLRFGEKQRNTSVLIFVSNFSAPNQIRISLIQRDEILLTILLFLFCGLLGALLVAGVMWKLKLTFDAYRQRVMRATQLKDMASRPYARVYLCCDDAHRSARTFLLSSPGAATQPDHGVAAAICDERCGDDLASVVSVFLWLPSCVSTDRCNVRCKNSVSMNDIFPPDGQPGLAIGTVLTKGVRLRENRVKKTVKVVPDSRTDHISLSPFNDQTLSIVHTYENEAMAIARV